MKLDILVLPVHPDDAELGCSGTILKEVALGKNTNLCLTDRKIQFDYLKPDQKSVGGS